MSLLNPVTNPVTVAQNPITNQATQQVTFPHQNRWTFPSPYPIPLNPVTNPPQNPITYPPQNPITYPQQNPITYPPQNPITYPQQNPITYPQQNPITYPQQNPMTSYPQQQNPVTSYPQQNPITSYPQQQNPVTSYPQQQNPITNPPETYPENPDTSGPPSPEPHHRHHHRHHHHHNMPPMGTRVDPYDSAYNSSLLNLYTGIIDIGTLNKVNERAIQDPSVLLYAPVSDFGNGPLFPGVMSGIVDIDEALREKLTTFKGPIQLYVGEEGTQDSYSNRQVLPQVWSVDPVGVWHVDDPSGKRPFTGYPNPNMFYLNTDVVFPNHYGSIDNTTLNKALAETGDMTRDWEKHLGELIGSDGGMAVEIPAKTFTVPSDGQGIQNPDSWGGLVDQYEKDHAYAYKARLQYQDDNGFPLGVSSDPSLGYMQDQLKLWQNREGIYVRDAPLNIN